MDNDQEISQGKMNEKSMTDDKFAELTFKFLEECENTPIFSKQEEAYRRGYSQGFLAARVNEDLTIAQVYAWRHGDEQTAPPGSYLAGQHMHGLLEDETHRFFINRLDK